MDRVMVCYQLEAAPCRWQTESGVSLGTNLQQLEMLNGRAFQIEPWGYDLGGNISSWRGGKLARVFGEGQSRQVLLTVYFKKRTSLLNKASYCTKSTSKSEVLFPATLLCDSSAPRSPA
jgi:hypothetical protein